MRPSSDGPAAGPTDSGTGKRRLLKTVAGGVGLVLAVGFGWWLSTVSEDRTPGVVVELELPPKAPAEQTASTGSPESVSVEKLPDQGPDPSLIEPGASGPLPRISDDGREPWRVYARAFDSRDDRPRLVVIVTGLGLSTTTTEDAIRRLPASVTLAFSPYAKDGENGVRMARRFGHEILLSLPLEPVDFPFDDPGPYALLTSLSSQENLDRLEFLLSRFTGYVGVIGVMGSKFNKNDDSVRPVLLELRDRGLMYVEGKDADESVAPMVAAEIGVPRVLVDITLDDVPSKEAIDGQLARLEDIAGERAVAVALARPYPITLERLVAWASTLDGRGLVLAPVTAAADAQFLP